MNCYMFEVSYPREIIIIRLDSVQDAWDSLKDTHRNVYDRISYKGELMAYKYASIKQGGM